jgi:hypothetical protein
MSQPCFVGNTTAIATFENGWIHKPLMWATLELQEASRDLPRASRESSTLLKTILVH